MGIRDFLRCWEPLVVGIMLTRQLIQNNMFPDSGGMLYPSKFTQEMLSCQCRAKF